MSTLDPTRCKTQFFTEADKLSSQTSTKAFGNQSATKYNLSSYHSATSTPKAFAVREGTLFAVKQDATHLNLILMPTSPIGDFLPSIFCFIYKGIKRSSLLTSDDLFVVEGDSNDIISRIHENNANANAISIESEGDEDLYQYSDPDDYSDWGSSESDTSETYEEPETFVPDVDSRVILPFKNEPGSAKIRDLLINEDNEPIFVSAGDHIGDFDQASFGFEIIMERWEMEPDLDLVRKGEHCIEVDNISYVGYYFTSNIEIFRNKLAREAVLNFMDPAAFFGTFFLVDNYYDRLKYTIGGAIKATKESELYNDVISKFHNHDVIYIDLRNALNYSLNLSGNLSDDITINPAGIHLKLVNYLRNSWPILALTSADFNVLSAEVWGDHTQRMNIVLPLEPNLPAPEVYIHCKEIARQSFTQKRVKNHFVSGNSDEITAVTYSIDIGTRSKDPYIPVANYFRFTYGTNYPGYLADVVDFSKNIHLVQSYLDQLFIPFTNDLTLTGNQKMIIKKYSDDRMIPFQPSLRSSFLCERGVAIGEGVVTFFAYPRIKATKDYTEIDKVFNIPSMVDFNNSNLLEKIASDFASAEAVAGFLSFEAAEPIPFHGLVQLRNISSLDPDVKQLITLSLTVQEYSDIKDLRDESGFSDSFPVYFGVTPRTILNRDIHNRSYTQYNLVLRGMTEDTVQDKVTVKEVATEKIITYVEY